MEPLLLDIGFGVLESSHMFGGPTIYQRNVFSHCDRARESRDKEAFLSLFFGSSPTLSSLRALFLFLLYYSRGMKPFLLRLTSLPLSGRLLTVSSIMTELITPITLYVKMITVLTRFLAFKPFTLIELGN